MAQQTAVDYLMNELKSHLEIEWPMNIWLRKKLEQAKQMEKEQIMNAWLNSETDSMYEPQQLSKQAEQYYNETYNK